MYHTSSTNVLLFEMLTTCALCIRCLMKINFGNTISCTSGLIINILLFYGIGPVFYLYDESLNENLDKAVVLNQMELLYPYLITGLFFSFSIFHAKNKYSHIKN